MMRTLLRGACALFALAVVFVVGFITGQVSEAAYRFRNQTGEAIAVPGMVEMVQSGRWTRGVVANASVHLIEQELHFLRNPLSIYPHADQAYEKMPHRIKYLETAIENLKTTPTNTTMSVVVDER